MSRTHTHTFATLEVSAAAYHEIKAKLADAGYQHAFVDDAIAMHGIGLVRADAGRSLTASSDVARLVRMLDKATVRLGILRDRMEGCDEGRPDEQKFHGLSMVEVPDWVDEQLALLATITSVAADGSDQQPPTEHECRTVAELRGRITWQQTRALLRVADNEAVAGDVALCRELARAIAWGGSAAVTELEAANGVARAAIEVIQDARAALELPKGAQLSAAIQLLAEFTTALMPGVAQHENDSVRWSAQELHDGMLELRAGTAEAAS